MPERSVVSQRWPIAGHGEVILTVFTDVPDAKAIRLLGQVVAAIEAYQSAIAAEAAPPTPSGDETATPAPGGEA